MGCSAEEDAPATCLGADDHEAVWKDGGAFGLPGGAGDTLPSENDLAVHILGVPVVHLARLSGLAQA